MPHDCRAVRVFGHYALGWHAMGDLSKLNSDREAFKAAVADTYPNKKPGAIPNNAGQLFRFVHEMEEGDLVVFPNKNDRKINVGRVEPPPIPSNAANLTPWTKSNFLAVASTSLTAGRIS